jgi:glycosyltransferase involved in cell wall biosynthesis
MPDISVIIPAYNRADLIGETLRSLLNQTLPAQEIIVVDDGSSDGTADKTLEAFENWKLEIGNLKNDDGEQVSAKSTSNIQHPTFKILRQANAGPGAARNRGLAEATGEFIHFFDSDDVAALNKHEVQLKALLETEADIAYGPWVKGRLVNLTTIEHWGRCEKEQSKVGPKGEGVGTNESKDTENRFVEKQGVAWTSQADAVFSKPSTSELALDFENTSLTRSASEPASSYTARYQLPATRNFDFQSQGPVLQAKGLPSEDLVRALLTNWSVVPHACLFRRSILEKVGGFPKDIWVGEDQLLFLRCLLAGAKVVHTPETMVFYRLGDAGKLTESKEGQRRRVVDWGKFLVKASVEVSSAEWREVSESRRFPAAAQRRGEGNSAKNFTTEATESEEAGATESKAEPAQRPGSQAGTSKSDSLPSELADSPVSESLTRSASIPAAQPATRHSLPATSYSLPVTTTPSAWFGFRLRAYEAWRDLRAFFPGEYLGLESGLEKVWKRNGLSGFKFWVSGFMLRKLGGLLQRLTGSRAKRSFRVEQYNKQESGLFPKQYRSK